MAASLQEPVTIAIKNNDQASISLSSTDVNRVFVRNDKINDINAPDGRLTAHNDKSGSLYVNINGNTPFTMFLNTVDNRHFSILVVPKKIPGSTIEFIPRTPISINEVAHSDEAKRFESSSPYEKTLIKLIKTSMVNKAPSGYSAVTPTVLKQMKIGHVKKYIDKKVTEELVGGYLGGDLAVRVIKVTNKSHKSMKISASQFYRPDVRAVAIDNEYLSPGDVSVIYEVTDNV